MTSTEYKEQLSEALGKLAGVHAVGDSWITFDGSIPAGGVPFTGQLVTRAMYADLWAWVQANKTVVTDSEWQTTANAQNGMNAAYSSGDGSTTFRLPCAVGGYLQVGDTSTAGRYVKEGLPNIKATSPRSGYNTNGDTSWSGSLYPGKSSSTAVSWPAGSSQWEPAYFDASRSSPVYRDDCQHVTPETFKVMVGVYAFGVTGPVGEATEEGILAELGAHGAKLGALENGVGRASAYITETWRSGYNWYRKWSDGWIEQGGRIFGTNTSGHQTLHTAFSSDEYALIGSGWRGDTSYTPQFAFAGRTTTSFSWGSSQYSSGIVWYAYGY